MKEIDISCIPSGNRESLIILENDLMMEEEEEEEEDYDEDQEYEFGHGNEKNSNNSIAMIDIPSTKNDGADRLNHYIIHSLNQPCHCTDIDSFIELMKMENPFILSGFREYTTRSWQECFKSMFTLHCDTFNIWTHLIPSMIYYYVFIDQLLHYKFQTDNKLQTEYKFNLLVYIASCGLCFFASSFYHTVRSHSITTFKRALMFDVSSIGILILTSVNLIISYELSCYPTIKNLFLFSFLFLVAATLSLLPKIMREKKFGTRTLMFSVLALQGLMSHLLRYYLDGVFMKDRFQLLLSSYIVFGIGLSIRRLKIPELLSPGKFDIFFSSHQIFHVLVTFGTYFIYIAYGNGIQTCEQ